MKEKRRRPSRQTKAGAKKVTAKTSARKHTTPQIAPRWNALQRLTRAEIRDVLATCDPIRHKYTLHIDGSITVCGESSGFDLFFGDLTEDQAALLFRLWYRKQRALHAAEQCAATTQRTGSPRATAQRTKRLRIVRKDGRAC